MSSSPRPARRKPERKSTPLESIATTPPDRRRPPCKHCAASARQRSCRSSRFGSGFVSEFACRNNLFRERFKLRLAAQWIDERVNSDPPDVSTGAILITLFEPAQRLLFVAECEINNRKAIHGDVALPGYLFQ